MQADQQITLELGGNRFRIVSSSPELNELLRRELDGYIAEGDAFLGFKIESTTAPGAGDGPEFHILLDCTGNVLARSRRPEAVLAALAGHLASLEIRPPSGSVGRYRLRTLVADDHAVLVVPPLFTDTPLVERRLVRSGYEVVDAPYVDIDSDSHVLKPTGSPASMMDMEPDTGHAVRPALGQIATHLLWPTSTPAARPTRAQVCQALASAALTGDREQRLDHAERLAAHVTPVQVQTGRHSSVYDQLRLL